MRHRHSEVLTTMPSLRCASCMAGSSTSGTNVSTCSTVRMSAATSWDVDVSSRRSPATCPAPCFILQRVVGHTRLSTAARQQQHDCQPCATGSRLELLWARMRDYVACIYILLLLAGSGKPRRREGRPPPPHNQQFHCTNSSRARESSVFPSCAPDQQGVLLVGPSHVIDKGYPGAASCSGKTGDDVACFLFEVG